MQLEISGSVEGFLDFAGFFEAVDITSEKEVHAFESDDHVVSGTSGAEADALAERTESIFVQAIFIVLSHAVSAKLPFTNVLII